ncbi:MAG: hypothetical protein K5695_12765 [Oscillospiraceae bacterium]|nr:hypothetical protein [Oscillospiraceae bacterium]
MKRGISIEYDMHEDCYIIQKQRGTLTLEEIQQALNEHHGEDQFFIYFDTNNSFYDEQASVAPKGDCVKAYTYSAIERMFKKEVAE